MLLKACEALAYAHDKGVIHRDVKPANIMVGRFGEVYVMDWGLARAADRKDRRDIRLDLEDSTSFVLRSSRDVGHADHDAPESPLATRDGTVVGTPAYMSPEQARGELDVVGPRSDVYSMGAILYQLLAGKMPFVPDAQPRTPRSVLTALLDGPPVPIRELADVPVELEAICDQAMARQPVDRYPDMSALAVDLRAYLEQRVVSAYETGAIAELRMWVVRNKPLAASVAAVFVLLLVGGSVVSWQSGVLADKNTELTETNASLDSALDDAEEQRALADDNALEAQVNERLAQAHAEAARVNAELAQSNADRAERERANVLRLSAFQQLKDLQREADEMWPATQDLMPAYVAWLALADALVAGLQPRPSGNDPGHRRQLEVLRKRALPRTPSEREQERRAHPRHADLLDMQQQIAGAQAAVTTVREGLAGAEPSAEVAAKIARIETWAAAAVPGSHVLDAEISERHHFTFVDPNDLWWHNQLTRLIAEIEAFADPEAGLIDGRSQTFGWGIARRGEHAQTVTERTLTGSDAQGRWSQASASIADREQCPAYDGLVLPPQLGLLPVGRDPDSGLWEFWHVMSGVEPRRGDDGKLVLTETTGIVLVLIPGGRFAMGAQRGDPSGPNHDPEAAHVEGPVHDVTLSPYFLSKYELTQGQWLAFWAHNPSDYVQGNYSPGWDHTGRGWSALHPVERVSWDDCARTLSRMELTLPSEAQWEFGCRAGTSSRYWTGNDVLSLQGVANESDLYGQAHGNATYSNVAPLDDGHTIHAPVGSFRANAFGLHDVHGNVREWCLDAWDGTPYEIGTVADPVKQGLARRGRVFRDGSFDSSAATARSASRDGQIPDTRVSSIGLRPARAVTR